MAGGLTDKQQAFVEHYLTCWNATEAARKAGYAEPSQQGHRLLRNVEIATAVSHRLDEMAMPANEVLARLGEHARGSMDDFLEIDEFNTPRFNWKRAKEAGKLHLIKKFSETKHGVSFEMYDAQTALIQLGKAYGLFVDKIAPTDPTGQKPYDFLSDDERSAKLAELLDRARARRDGSSASDDSTS